MAAAAAGTRGSVLPWARPAERLGARGHWQREKPSVPRGTRRWFFCIFAGVRWSLCWLFQINARTWTVCPQLSARIRMVCPHQGSCKGDV